MKNDILRWSTHICIVILIPFTKCFFQFSVSAVYDFFRGHKCHFPCGVCWFQKHKYAHIFIKKKQKKHKIVHTATAIRQWILAYLLPSLPVKSPISQILTILKTNDTKGGGGCEAHRSDYSGGNWAWCSKFEVVFFVLFWISGVIFHEKMRNIVRLGLSLIT